MKLFNCIAFLTIVSAILIGLAIGYRDDPLTFRLLAALGSITLSALTIMVLMGGLRSAPPTLYDPED